MMIFDSLGDYIKKATAKGLVHIEPVLEADVANEDYDSFFVTKTKEIYHLGGEKEADGLIDEARQDPSFVGCDKKFKAGKVNKQGEQLKPDVWIVTIKFSHPID